MTKTVREIADHVKGIVVGDGNVVITGVGSLENATQGQISFVAQRKYLGKMDLSRASAFIVPMEVTEARVPVIRTENSYLAYALTVSLFATVPFRAKGVSPQAWVGENCEIDGNVSIYPYSYIGDDVRIASEVTIYPGVHVGNGVSIGQGTTIYPQAAIMDRCIVGTRVIIHGGVIIGADGFGYARDGNRHAKIPQIGIVQIDDDVEIGANTTIDRAALGKTWVKRGTKIDNLVQVAHNVVIGEDTLIIAQVGISGSVVIGNNVIVAGQAGIAGHCTIGDGVMIGGQSGVPGSLKDGEIVSGSPAIPHRKWLRASAAYQQLPDILTQVRALKERIAVLEEKLEKKEGK